ncbi:hypothetical protein OESDEN_21635, partial [Oesophagostomum dentatum]
MFKIPHCETTHSDVRVLLDEDSLLVLIQGLLQSSALSLNFSSLAKLVFCKVSDAVKTKICETVLEAVKFVDAQELQPGVSIVSTTTPAVPSENAFNPAEFGASLCEVSRLEHAPSQSTSSSIGEESLPSPWGANLDLVYPPRFTEEDVVFGVDGGVLYNGAAAENVENSFPLNISVLHEKMVGILLSDCVANSLFSHLFSNGMGNVYYRFEAQDLPRPIRKLATMMCSKCYLDITANLTEQPMVEINAKQGVRVELAGNILIQFQGREELHNLIYATTKLHVTLKPTIRHSRLYADVALTQVDVKVFDLAVGGVLAKPIEKLVSLVVPRVLWPQMKKRIRFALNKR